MNPIVYPTRAIPAYRSDIYNIPYGNIVFSGINPESGNLIGYTPGVDYLVMGFNPGDIVSNDDDGTYSSIQSVVASDSILTEDSIFTSGGQAFSIYQGENSGCILYVANTDNEGGVADIKVLTADNDIILFPNFKPGNVLPVKVLRVFSTDTYSGKLNLIALW